MHGELEISRGPRVAGTVLHAVFLGAAAWICAAADAGDPGRRALLVGFGVILFARLTVTFFLLLRRRFAWQELGGVLSALLVYQVGFALLGARTATPLGWVDAVAVALFLLGSYLNTGAELQRWRFKQDPANRGQLFTGGLFRLARHINFFGDTLWVAAWALVTRNPWAALVPLALALGFVFAFIPSLTAHLRTRYGAQFEAWEKRTRAYIPFIY
jgi:steroid 5-alpha reductase family enzyme